MTAMLGFGAAAIGCLALSADCFLVAAREKGLHWSFEHEALVLRDALRIGFFLVVISYSASAS